MLLSYIPTMDTGRAWILKNARKLRVKLSMLALAMIAFALVGHAVLGVTYFQQQRQQHALASEIEAARQSLVEYGDAASRQEQRATAEAEVATEQALFPSWISGPGTVMALIQLAEESGLKVADIATQPGREQQVGEHSYRSLSVHVQAEGTLSALHTFVTNVEAGALQAARVDEMRITGIEQPPAASSELSLEEPSTPEVQHSVTASVDFSVYARD